MNYLFIIIPAIVIAIALLYSALKGAHEIEEKKQNDPPVIKFQPRKVTDFSIKGIDPYEEEKPVVAPKKKKYYKKRPKKTE